MAVQRLEIGTLRKVLEFNTIDSRVDPMLYKCLLAKAIKMSIEEIEFYSRDLGEVVYNTLTLDCPKVYKSIIDKSFDTSIFGLIHESPTSVLTEITCGLKRSVDFSKILKVLEINMEKGVNMFVEIEEHFYHINTGECISTIKREVNEDILIITDEV